MEEVYGRELEEMLSVLELAGLKESLRLDFESRQRDTWLYLDLGGRNPDDGLTVVPYDKGHFFLRTLENAVGRDRWDIFLKRYFEEHAFQTMDSATFLDYLHEHLIGNDRALEEGLQVDAWGYGPGLPPNCPNPVSKALEQVRLQVRNFEAGTPAASLATEHWTTHHFLYFLRHLPVQLKPLRLADLDRVFGFTNTRNSEILHDWLLLSVKTRYSRIDDALEEFLVRQGRRKFLVPLYAELARSREGLEKARRIYAQARSGYHGISRRSVEELLGD